MEEGARDVLEVGNSVGGSSFVLSLVVARELGFLSLTCVKVKWGVKGS
jgi:hypothetical protein